MASFACPYCSDDYLAPSEALLLHHIRLAHSLDPDFSIQCSFRGCSRNFTNFRTYQNHRLTHRNTSTTDEEDDTNDDDPTDDTAAFETDPDVHYPTATDIQSFSAKWILNTRETRSLTRAATQGVIEDVGDMVAYVSKTLESQTNAALRSCGVDPDTIPGLKDVFSGPATTPFEGLSSFHQQLQYCRRYFHFIVRIGCAQCHVHLVVLEVSCIYNHILIP